MTDNDNQKVYFIPDNFLDEGRIFRGMFKTRNFIEGFLMAVVVGIFAYMIPAPDFNTKVFIMVAICGPVFLIGVNGFNGDPLSITLINAKKWMDTKGLILYDDSLRPLIKSPLQAMYEKEMPRDKIVNIIDQVKEKQERKNQTEVYIPGVTCEFEDDKDLEVLYVKNYELTPEQPELEPNQAKKGLFGVGLSAAKNNASSNDLDFNNELNLDDIFGEDKKEE